jgi:hypothetical protein
MLNGRFWQDIGLEGKLGYLSAFMDFSTYNALTGWKNEKDPSQYKWATGFVIIDYIKELDSLYSHPENLNIPVSMAIPYCTVKLRGDSSAAAMESLIMDLRKWQIKCLDNILHAPRHKRYLSPTRRRFRPRPVQPINLQYHRRDQATPHFSEPFQPVPEKRAYGAKCPTLRIRAA